VDNLNYRTVFANAATVDKKWVIVDANGHRLGRLASKVAKILRGKYKPNFTPHVDCGDNVIIINASKIVLTGNKLTDRIYLSYTGYPGGQKQINTLNLLRKSSEHFFKKVIKGMLPKNRLGAKILKNLYVYNGTEHKHEAQKPEIIDINSFK
jgi:large subunit ribosomal protein L13